MSKKLEPLGEVGKTESGFEKVEFQDHYSTRCSLQASSLAIYEKPGTSAVWLGIDANQKVLANQAYATRMHLNREQVEALIAHLQKWLARDTFKL